MIRQSSLLFAPLFVLIAFAAACKDELPTQDDLSSIVFPDTNISYGSHIQPLFSARCLSCHNGLYEPNLEPSLSYDNLRNYRGGILVVPGESNKSLLVQLLEGSAQPIMPPTGQPLTANQINGIKKWIDEGALNN